MEVKYQDKELLESSSFLALGNGETTLTVRRGQEAITFVLNFEDVKDGESSVRYQIVDERTLKINLVNWNSPLGTTFLEPQEVGTFANRQLYILLFVKKAGSKGSLREVTFSAYLGQEVPPGKA